MAPVLDSHTTRACIRGCLCAEVMCEHAECAVGSASAGVLVQHIHALLLED